MGTGADAGTYITAASKAQLRGTQEEMVIIDTPGLGDPQGNDTQNIADMIDYLIEAKFVNAFIVVFNG